MENRPPRGEDDRQGERVVGSLGKLICYLQIIAKGLRLPLFTMYW